MESRVGSGMSFDLGIVSGATFYSFSDYGNVRTWGNVIGLPEVPDNAVALPGRDGKVFADFAPHDRRFQVGLMLIGTSDADAMDKAIELSGLLWNTTDPILFRRIIPTGSGDVTHEAYGRYLRGFEMPLDGLARYSTMVLEFELLDAYWFDSGDNAVTY